MSLPSSRHSHEMPPRKRPTLLVTVLPRKAPRPRLPRLSHPRPRCPPNPAGGGNPPPPPSSFRLLCFILRAFLAAAYSYNSALADTQDIGRDLSNLNDQPPRIHPFCPRRTHLSAPSARARRRL